MHWHLVVARVEQRWSRRQAGDVLCPAGKTCDIKKICIFQKSGMRKKGRVPFQGFEFGSYAFFVLAVSSESQRNLSVCLELFTNDRFHNWRFWDPELQPQILGLFDRDKMLAITWLPAWIPPDLSLSASPPHSSHFLIKSKECLRDLCWTGRKRQREIVFLSICHAGEAPGHGAPLFYTSQTLRRGKRGARWNKKPTIITCRSSPRPVCFRPDLFNDLCVSEPARFHSSPAQYFTSVQTKKKKTETSARGGQTNQFERADKCNKPKVYFSTPTKWVLRYCITLFI